VPPLRALVTGATGLVGSHIVERLRKDGWSVRALVRNARDDDEQPSHPSAWRPNAWLRERDAELVTGNVLDLTAFAQAAAGCDVVFHAAAAVAAKSWEEYKTMNVDGARNAVGAAARAGARLVHVSSVAVYGASGRYRADGAKTDEAMPLAPLADNAWYARSKRESETLVLDAHRDGRVWATALRPSVIYGPRDRYLVPRMGRIVSLGVAPKVGAGSNTLSIVHAASVADGVVRAATLDVAGGKVYNIAHDFDVTSAEFFELASVGVGKHVRFVTIPRWLLGASVSAFRRILSLVSGGSLGMVSDGAAASFLTRDNPFSSALARSELGWSPPVAPDIGIPDAFRWWKEHR
jgi:nucleoside-diphosphate-sugar epimerase